MTPGSDLGDWTHGGLLTDTWNATDDASLEWKISLFLTCWIWSACEISKYPVHQWKDEFRTQEERENSISNFPRICFNHWWIRHQLHFLADLEIVAGCKLFGLRTRVFVTFWRKKMTKECYRNSSTRLKVTFLLNVICLIFFSSLENTPFIFTNRQVLAAIMSLLGELRKGRRKNSNIKVKMG